MSDQRSAEDTNVSKINKIRELLNATGSQIFHIWFIKKDGTLRHMACQVPAVETHKSLFPDASHAQGAATRIQQHPELFAVFDLESRAIRSFDMNKLVRATINKKQYEFMSSSEQAYLLGEDYNVESINQ